MPWTYKMIQVPPNIEVDSSKYAEEENAASSYLSDLVNKYAKKGWEFYRIDTIGVMRPPGCLAVFLSQGPTQVLYNVITFRKESVDEET